MAAVISRGAQSVRENLDLDRVRAELDRLVELRFACPFTPGEQRRYDTLLAREVKLLERIEGRPRRHDSV